MSQSESLPEPWSGVREQLHERGMRWTPQRRTVIEVLAASSGHVTSAELIERCRALDAQTIPSTVYRTLDALEQLGLVRHGHGADGREEFHVGPDAEHGHLYCADCGARSEIRAAEADADRRRPSRRRWLRGRPVARDGGGPLRHVRRRVTRRMSRTFLGLPSVDPAALGEPGDADAVVLGVPFGVPYPTPGPAAGCAEAPAAIRARSQRLASSPTHHDFDLDGPMLPSGSPYRVADAGDVPGSRRTAPATRRPPRRWCVSCWRRGGAAAAGRRRLGADPLPAGLRRPRAVHRRPGRRPPRLPRRERGRAGRLLVGDATRVRDGARRAHRAGRPARGRQRAALGRRRCPRRRQLLVTARELRRARRAVAAGAAAGRRSGGGGLRPGWAGPVGGAGSERHRAGWADLRPGRGPAAGADRPHPGGRCRLHRDGACARRQRPDGRWSWCACSPS